MGTGKVYSTGPKSRYWTAEFKIENYENLHDIDDSIRYVINKTLVYSYAFSMINGSEFKLFVIFKKAILPLKNKEIKKMCKKFNESYWYSSALYYIEDNLKRTNKIGHIMSEYNCYNEYVEGGVLPWQTKMDEIIYNEKQGLYILHNKNYSESSDFIRYTKWKYNKLVPVADSLTCERFLQINNTSKGIILDLHQIPYSDIAKSIDRYYQMSLGYFKSFNIATKTFNITNKIPIVLFLKKMAYQKIVEKIRRLDKMYCGEISSGEIIWHDEFKPANSI